MSRRRFIADLVSSDRANLTGAHAAHLIRVLRARVGQEFDIAAGGRVRRGTIIQLGDELVEFELFEEVPTGVLPPVTLYLSVFKFDRMEWAIEKCTELGVARIIPVAAARSATHLVAASGKRVERWRRLALQAAEQSRAATPPEITAPLKWNRETLHRNGKRIVLAESEHTLSLKQALAFPPAERPAHGGRLEAPLALAIGPEGGWTDNELAAFSAAGWVFASLGTAILRVETAAIAAVAIVMSELQD